MTSPLDRLRSFTGLRRVDAIVLVAFLVYPLVGPLEDTLFNWTGVSLGEELTNLFIYMLVAVGLNVVVGYTGLLHLGIAGFFGIGAYVTGILTVPAYPFQIGFTAALVCSTVFTGLCGLILAAPCLRLRGDYLAIVTLGFGEVVRYTLRNMEQITAGTRGLNPVQSPQVPDALVKLLASLGISADLTNDYRLFYYLALGLLLVVLKLLSNLERSRLGRAWIAVREDELAASCMGIRTARAKLAAFGLGAALAGMAGCLYATTLRSTADPNAYDFGRSITILCCIILGGLGSLRGACLGVLLLMGFDSIVAPTLDGLVQRSGLNPTGHIWLTFSTWRLMIFGLALILAVRLRPHGLLPAERPAL
jgi:branched-chain amino acid transport system permease protein